MKNSIVILQENVAFAKELAGLFEASGLYEVSGIAHDGINGLKTIEEKRPNFVIMDLLLTGIDGLGVLDCINEKKIETKVIILSSLMREEIVTQAMNKGARYYMAKPFNFELLKQRMSAIAEGGSFTEDNSVHEVRKISLEEKISRIFINVGIPPHIKGYSYLRESVKLVIKNPNVINHITKELYPQVGEYFNTTASKVERAIRHAIEVAWNRGRIESINQILGVRAYVGAEKPTNGEFIALIADKMLLEENY